MAMSIVQSSIGTLVEQALCTKSSAGAEQKAYTHGFAGFTPELVLIHGLADGSANPEIAWSITAVSSTTVTVDAPTTTGTDTATAVLTIFKTVHTLIG